MASNDALRRFGKRPAKPGRFGVPVPALVAAAAAGLAVLLVLSQLAPEREQQAAPARSFLTSALGAPQASASLVRKPEHGVTLRVDASGARFARAGSTVGISLEGTSGTWRRHLRGATRPTSFGQEAIVFRGAYGLEHFSRVEHRQGTRTWRWNLDAPGLTPRLADDGGVDFFRVDRSGEASAGIRIRPPAIFDEARREVGPDRLRWNLARSRSGWTLALRFDDSEFPLPYVIDPDVARTSESTAIANNATSVAPVLVGAAGDVLIAQVAIGSNATINAPSGWTPLGTQRNSGTSLTQRLFWAPWSAGLSTSFSWAGNARGAAGISSYSDVHSVSPVGTPTAGSGTGTTATAPSVTTTFAKSMLVAAYASVGYQPAPSAGDGLAQSYTAISGGNASTRVGVTGADGLQAAAGASGAKTATMTSSPWVAHLVALRREPPDGGGTMTTGTTGLAASSTGNTIAFTYTAPTEGLVDGEVALAVPAGWSAPSASAAAPGYTTVSTGTVSFSSQTIVVSGLTLAGGATLTITYGAGSGATASSATDAVQWTTQQKGTSGGTFVALAAQPSITQYAADGSGTMTTPTTNVFTDSTGNTLTFTYTAPAGGVSDGAVSIDVPAGWSAPSTTGGSPGYSTSTAGTVAVAGRTITVSGLTLAAGASFDVVYGATSGGGTGATAPSTAGTQVWQAKQRSLATGTLTDLAASPAIGVDATDGLGSIAPLSTTVGYGSVGNTLTFTYTAASTMTDGAVAIDVPAAWSTPSTTATAEGFSTSTAGSLAVAGQTITVSGLSLASGETFDVVYGATSGGGPGATAPASAGSATWTTQQRSTAGGTLTEISSSPSVTVAARPAAPSALATTPASPANDTSPAVTGAAPAGSTVRVYAAADCSGPVAATGTAATFGGAGLSVAVVDNATTSLSATATDGLGAVSPCSTSVSYTADSVAPAAPTGLAVAPASPANDNDPRVSGTAEAGSTVTLYASADCTGTSVSGTAAAFGGSGLDPADVADDSSTSYTAKATDAAGNPSLCSSPVAYLEDSTAPTSSVSFPVAGSYRPDTWNDPSGTASDSGGAGLARVEVSLRRVSTGLYWDGSAFSDASENWRAASGTAAWSLTFPASNFPADGDYVLRVRALDDAGNAEAAASRTVTLDDAAPETTIDGSPADPSNATGPSFSFSSSEAGSSFECRLDGGSWVACTSPEDLAGLAQGGHTFDVRATDGAGNVDATPASFAWTIDTTDPSAAFTFPAAGGFYNAAAWEDVAGTASDGGGAALDEVEVSVRNVSSGLYWDGAAFAEPSESWRAAAGTASWTLAFAPANFSADGDYVVRVRASDTAGNVQAPVSRTFSVDTVAPQTTIDSSPADPTNATTAAFSFSADEGGSTFECRLDGGTWSACTTPENLADLAEGDHTFDVRATDAAGNTDATPASSTWAVDTTAPQTTIDSQPDDPTNATTAAFSFSADEGGSTFECRLDGGTWSACTSAENLAGLAEGDRTFDVRATDAAGNTDATPASFTWTVDTTAPSTTIISSPASPSNAASADFTFDAGEAGTTFECRIDGGAWEACSSPKSYASLSGGAHTFDVRAIDAAGNVDTSPASHGWTIDATPPTSVVSFPASGGVYNPGAWSDPSGTASDGGGAALDRVELSIRRASSGLYWDGTAFADGSENWRPATGAASWTHSFAAGDFPADGDYVLRVRAHDTVGNAEAPIAYTVTFDATAPETAIDAQPADPSNSGDADFVFSSPEPGSSFECRLDGGSWSTCTSPYEATGLAAGTHSFDVRATDAAGNVDSSPASTTWTVDLAAPSSSIGFPAASGSYNATGWADPSGTASDAVALDRVEVSLRHVATGLYWDGTGFSDGAENWRTASGTATWSLAFAAASFPADGDYAIRVRARDAAGNVETPSTRTFTVDTVAPATTIDSGPAGKTKSADATFAFSADQPGSTFACRLDGGSWSTCTSPHAATGLAQGPHTFDVRATDAGGNTDATPASRTWTVDTVPPSASLTAPSSGAYVGATVSLTASTSDAGGTGIATVSFEKSAAGAGSWTPVAAPWVTAAGDDGLYDLRVVATDNAGNVTTSSPATNVRVDNTPPNAVVDSPGATVSGTVTLTQSSTDAGSGVDPATVAFEYRAVPAGSWTPTGAGWETTSLDDGQYELRVTVGDRAGNETTSAVETTVVDNTAPTVAFTVPTDLGYVNAASADPLTLAAEAADAGSGVEDVEFFVCDDASCSSESSLGADSSGPYEAAWSLPGSDGAVTLKALARDAAGHEAESVITVTVDRALPDTSLAANPGNPSNDATPDFTFSSTEPGTFECRIDGGLWSPCSSPHTTASLADGTHTFDVRALDDAGNVDASAASWTWLVDTTAPAATMVDPGDNLRLLVNLTSTQSDPGGAASSGIASVQYEYSVAGAATWVATPAAWNTQTVTDGLYDLRVVVADVAGNVTESAVVAGRRVDNAPPATAIDDPGANLRGTVALAASASDTGSGVQQVVFELSPDGGSWSTVGMAAAEPFGASFDTTTMPDGLYFFRTVATDVAGNVATSAAVGPRRIDNTLPTAAMDDPGANLRGTVSLGSVSDDPPGPPVASGVSSVVYEALIGGTWTGISQTWATTSVPDGLYDLRVVVSDVAGNQTISNVVAGRRVDNTAPSTGHNAPGSWQSSGVTVSLSPSDGGSGIANTQYSIDGGGWNSGTTVNVAGDGIHTISFFSTDVAGNIESPQTATVMIDSTPPDPGASDPGNYLRGTVALTASPDAGDGGAAVTEVEFQHKRSSDSTWTTIAVDATDADNPPYTAAWATTPADDGSWDLRFVVRDEADNESVANLPSKIVDNTAPTGSLASPLGGSTVSGSVTLGVSANDDNPIASVEYLVNGGSVGSSSSAPYQVAWNSASSGDGAASIRAVITDMAGNSTTTGSVTVTVDNFAPTITLSAPAPNVGGSVGLSASASGDTAQVTFERRPAGGGGWTTIGTAVGGPWSATFDTTAVADGAYELRAIAVDAGSNSGTSNVVTTRVDNTAPTGLLTEPGDGAVVGGTVELAATASDPASGSGVAGVVWQARTGGGGFADVASAAAAPYSATWDVGGLPSGAYDLQLVVTDRAGNTFTTAFITVDVDATPPTVTLDDPGSPLSGTVSLSASTTGDATSVAFARSPAGAASWTAIGADGTAPYSAGFDTTAVGDGLYDLRAVVTDAVGNTSESVRAGVRVDNLVPIVTSSVPSNGSIVASADKITITATEDIASLTALELDGAPVVAPTVSGATAVFNTGALGVGSHTLAGTVHDAAGKSSSFTITFLVGVPSPPPSTGGGSFHDVLPVVPAPSGFRGAIEPDGTLTLRWTPAANANGEPYATVLFVDGLATRTFAEGDDEVNLGAFDAADMRTFAIASTDDAGRISPTSPRLRSTSVLAGKSVDEAAAVLANRGFALGAVVGDGAVVVAPAAAQLAELGSSVDVELGQPGTPPQTRLVFAVVGTKRYEPASRKFIALRVQATRNAQVSAVLLAPRGQRVYRWRFAAKPGTAIRRLTMPPQVRSKPGRYRLVFTVQSGRDSVKKTIVVQILPKKPSQARPDRRPVEAVLTGGSSMRRDIEAGVGKAVRVTAALDEETWTLAGSDARNVQVVLVDVDRFGLRLVGDLRLVFPSIRILALTNDPRRLAQSVRAGATIAVPRSTPPRDLAKLLVQLARRRS